MKKLLSCGQRDVFDRCGPQGSGQDPSRKILSSSCGTTTCSTARGGSDMFDKHLIRKINNGRCFILVGSGPSCEVGYPSWQRLAEMTYEELKIKNRVSDTKSYETYLKDKKYPEFFRQAERDLDDRLALVDMIKSLLNPSVRKRGVLYEMLAKWPFACYLTTNYDDEIDRHLSDIKKHFTVIRNRKEDFYNLRDTVSNLIQKLHSDLNHPDEVVLTSADYKRLYVEDSGQYFRDKLRQVFEMFDVLIIGHSLSDADIGYVLQVAKKTASPQHPIYMVAADFTKADEQEYLEKYNIVLVQYSNRDGTHSELRRILNAADRFIVPRQLFGERIETAARPKEEIETAVALFLYRRLQGGVQATDYLSPIVLAGLLSTGDIGIAREDIASTPALRKFAKGGSGLTESINKTIQTLLNQGLVDEVSGKVSITSSGRDKMQEYKTVRETEKDQAYGQFSLNLKSDESGLTEVQLQKCKELAEEVIVASFGKRALTIANQVFSGQSARPGELSDIFGLISDKAIEIQVMAIRAAFVEAMHQFLVEPTPPQRQYLASVSQGYFLYHLLGLDPKCGQVRQDIFQRTLWFCDSSVILPLAAVGCYNHDYASELFQMLTDAQAVLYTTPKLLKEAWEHFQWALNLIKNNGVNSTAFLRATLVKGSYKQNLFLDGYIRLSADGKVGSFKNYLELILQQGIDQSSFEAHIMQSGLQVKSVSDVDGFEEKDWGEIEEAKCSIRDKRKTYGTYRSELQVESEAEIWVFLQNLRSGKYSLPCCGNEIERVYFLSQSRVLDQVFPSDAVSTWTPEAVYRYVTTLPGKLTNPDLLQQCMLHDYFYAGISFIDKDRYTRYFGPSINAAKISYEQEKTKYIAKIEDIHAKQLDEIFNKTPDLEKPFFVAQMGWKLAEKSKRGEELAKQRAQGAEARVKQLESEKDKAWKIRETRKQNEEEARLRNLQDPNHVRKRKRQAKKRKKKKEKK